jgi:hypothetical protein
MVGFCNGRNLKIIRCKSQIFPSVKEVGYFFLQNKNIILYGKMQHYKVEFDAVEENEQHEVYGK